MRLRGSETARKAVHIAVGAFALLLRWLTWREAALMAVAAFLFNWRVLPVVGGRTLWRAEGRHGHDAGILLYPASVLALVLAFRHDLWIAAAVWGVLACGDGMATLAGQALGGPVLPWNARKTWAGLAAFVLCGATAAAALSVWTLRLPAAALLSPWVVGTSLALALACAVVESLPVRLDDNLTVPLAGALVMAALRETKAARFVAAAEVPARLLGGFVLTAALAALAWRARALDAAGAFSTVAIGTAVTTGLGWPGLAVMATFFVAGTAATRAGYRAKARRGIAQERGGARGWRSAWANGAVPAVLALAALAAPSGARELWVLAYAASVATAAADTCASEIGKACAGRTVSVASGRTVPPGTEGGISLEGTLGGLAGAALVAGVGAATGLHGTAAAVVVGLAGVLGTLAESALGALAGGHLGDDLLNVINTALGGAIAVLLAMALR